MKAPLGYALRGLDYRARLILLCGFLCVATGLAATLTIVLLLAEPVRAQSNVRLTSTMTIAYQLIVQDKDRIQANAELIAGRTLVSEALSGAVTTNLQNEVLEPTRQTMSLDFILVLGSDQKPIGEARRIAPALIAENAFVKSVYTSRRPTSGLLDTPSPDRTWIVAAAPVIHDDRTAGVVVVGRALDDSYANALSGRLAGYHVVITRNSAVIAASSAFQTLLTTQHVARPAPVQSLGQHDGVQDWAFGTQRLDASTRGLGFGSQASIALLQSHDNDLPLPASTRLRAALLILALCVLAIALVFVVVAWSLSPLRKLTQQVELATEPLGTSPAVRVSKSTGRLGSAVGHLLGASGQLHADLLGERTRLRDVLHSMPVGVVISDAAGGVTFTNNAARDLLGLNVENTTPFATPKDGIHTLEGNNGRVLAAVSSRISDNADAPAALVTVLQDVTREHQLEHMRSDFLSTISHELRTPLTAVKSSVDLLLDGDAGDMTTVQQRFLQTIQRNSERLIGLVSELLDLSRIESGQVHLNLNPIDVRRVVDDVANNLSNLFESKHQEVHLDLPVEPVLAQADRRRFEQVVTNLLANAGTYTPEGGQIRVSALTRDDLGLVEITVQDNGPGIPLEDQPRIFEKFFRGGHALTRQDGGAGLGLTIVRSLVELHHGTVCVSSEPGQGTCVTVALPLSQGESHADTPGRR